MESKGNLKIVLSLTGDSLCACRFMHGRTIVEWQAMSRDEQMRAIGAMHDVADMFARFVREGE